MHIAVIGLYDPQNPNAWSGIPFHIVHQLRERRDVRVTLHAPALADGPKRASAKTQAYRDQGRRYLWTRDQHWAALGGNLMSAALDISQPDIAIAFNPSDLAFLKTHVPVLLIVDATWEQYVSGYEAYQALPLCQETLDDAAIAEDRGFDHASEIICFTPWAAQGVAKQYSNYKDKVRVVLPGANFADAPSSSEVERYIRQRRSSSPFEMLFVGLAPFRKGFDVALQVCSALRKGGCDITLNAVGLNVRPDSVLPSFLRSYGRLGKDRVEESDRLKQLFQTANLFILPTRAECAGLVLCEAAAYALPVITSGVGGTRNLVIEGQTGFLLGAGATIDDYTQIIVPLLEDTVLYESLARHSRRRYESFLNWETFVHNLLRPYLDERAPERE